MEPLTTQQQETIRLFIADRLVEISELFKPGVKVTCIVRNPDFQNADILVTDDDNMFAVANVCLTPMQKTPSASKE